MRDVHWRIAFIGTGGCSLAGLGFNYVKLCKYEPWLCHMQLTCHMSALKSIFFLLKWIDGRTDCFSITEVLKWKCHHFGEIFITGFTKSYFDNVWCRQRWKLSSKWGNFHDCLHQKLPFLRNFRAANDENFHQEDDISFSVRGGTLS